MESGLGGGNWKFPSCFGNLPLLSFNTGRPQKKVHFSPPDRKAEVNIFVWTTCRCPGSKCAVNFLLDAGLKLIADAIRMYLYTTSSLLTSTSN